MKLKTETNLLLAVVLPLLAAACMVKDDASTVYIDRGGAVTWAFLEKDVHSDAAAAADQENEEAAYIAAVRATNHPIARGLAELAPLEVRTRILRGTVPFVVSTEGRFPDLATLGNAVIRQAGLAGTSTIVREGNEVTWMFSVRDPHAPNAAREPDDDLVALGNGVEHLKIVLVGGRFTATEGFELGADHRTATIIERRDNVFADQATYVLSLTWIVAPS